MKFIGTAFLLLLYTLGAQAQQYVLRGKIGTCPVVMELKCEPKNCFGTYYYTSSLKDLEIVGNRVGRTYRLFVLEPDNDHSKRDTVERFILTRQSDSGWSGTWENRKHRKLPVKLALSRKSYSGIRASLFTFAIDSSVKRGKLSLEFYHIIQAPAAGVRITGGLDKTIAQNINSMISGNVLSEAQGYCSCTNDYGTSEYSSSIVHFFTTDHIMSLEIQTAYDCGGPHPDELNQAFNINLDNGRQLQLPEVLQLYDSTNPQLQPEADSHFLTEDYAEALAELLTDLYPDKMVKAGGNCDYTGDVWTYSTWYFTAEGIHIQPKFPHIVMECGEELWSTIRYDVVTQYMDATNKIALP